MLKIDFTSILPVQKAVETRKPAKKKTKKTNRNVEEYLQLGDYRRLELLPDVVSVEFLSLYADGLDEILLPYVKHGMISIGYASRYKDTILRNIFGNENHLGMFHYLKTKDVEQKTDKELVSYAEKLLSKGTHIRQEGHQYWLVNAELDRLLEMTGRAPMAREVEALVFDESSAHIFLDESIASKLASLAKTIGQDADELALQGNLDVLLAKISDETFGGYVINYNAWRNILKKESSYPTSNDEVTPMDLYTSGFRLDSQITYPIAQHAVFTDGTKKYTMVPVSHEMNLSHGVNYSLLSVIAAKVKKDLLSGIAETQGITEVKNLQNTFALLVERWEVEELTYADISDILNRVMAHTQDGHSASYEKKVMEALASVFVTEYLLLGNAHMSLSAINLDSVGGGVYSYAASRYFDIEIPQVVIGEEFSLASLLRPVDDSMISGMIKILPKKFLSKLSAYELDLSSYPREFNSLKGYFEAAKQAVLGNRQ